MKNVEKKIRWEREVSKDKIDWETQRVINDHLPTIFAVNSRESDGRTLYPPEAVAAHIRSFFALADASIDEAGRDLSSPPLVVKTFKIMFRQLFTVATIESHLKAIQVGRKTALTLASGDAKKVLIYPICGGSGTMFVASAELVKHRKVAVDEDNPKVILLLDDVAHSGKQMREEVEDVIKLHDVPIVVSVGVATNRALQQLSEVLTLRDKIIFQKKALDLTAMIARERIESRRRGLNALAEAFFYSQSRKIERAMQATHIITPFKLPDIVSNGELCIILHHGRSLSFAMKYDDPDYNGLYPAAL